MSSGFFVIADISGYTSFLTESELEHAKGILEEIFESLLDAIRPPLEVSNIQGDAILCYTPDWAVAQGQSILDAVEQIYCAFSSAANDMRLNTTCVCKACKNISALDLKSVVHHGDYALQKAGERVELSGKDVIIVHRLLKNDVIEKTGIAAYALFTDAAVEAVGLPEFFDRLVRWEGSYDSLGAIRGRVHELRPAWEKRCRQKRAFVREDDPLWFDPIVVDLPARQTRAWAYVTEPSIKKQWLFSADDVTSAGLDGGRTGVGTDHHCAHGENTLIFRVADWSPPDYVTFEIACPFDAIVRQTIELTPNATGTRLSIRHSRPVAKTLLRTVAANFASRKLRNAIRFVLTSSGPALLDLATRDAQKRTLEIQLPKVESGTN